MLKHKSRNCLVFLRKVHGRDHMVICEIYNIFTERECEGIIYASSICNFQDMRRKYNPKKDRNNSRLLILIPDLTKHLWNQIETVLHVIQNNDIILCPLTFDVLKCICMGKHIHLFERARCQKTRVCISRPKPNQETSSNSKFEASPVSK